jgi:hypothetical protein
VRLAPWSTRNKRKAANAPARKPARLGPALTIKRGELKTHRLAFLAGVLLAGCAAAPGGQAGPTADPTAPAVPLTVVSSRYGALELRTKPLDTCAVAIKVDPGSFGDGPPKTLTARADVSGLVSWTYPAPLVPAGHGRHEVVCSGADGTRSVGSEFEIALKSLSANGFTARVQGVDPLAGLEGLSTKLEPSLVAARDASVARLNNTLVKEWSAATRGLGAVTLVTSSADIVIYVVPGRSSSLHLTSTDGSQRIVLHMVDDLGRVSTENSVAVALHELGHIWCCRGPGAGPDGHWLEPVVDPLLQGVDRFGLMTHPVTCLAFPGFVTCPNRFSERELRAMGFNDIPAPPVDPCVAKANALVVQIAALDASLASSRATIEATTARLRAIEARIGEIERQYPGGTLPSDVYPTYRALIDQYTGLLIENDAHVDAFNEGVAQRNALARQPLGC